MSETLARIQQLALERKVRVSDHGEEETDDDGMDPEQLVKGLASAVLIEDYPGAFKGPTVLVLQDYLGKPVHVVWGLSRFNLEVATLVTAYFPDPDKWYDGVRQRKVT